MREVFPRLTVVFRFQVVAISRDRSRVWGLKGCQGGYLLRFFSGSGSYHGPPAGTRLPVCTLTSRLFHGEWGGKQRTPEGNFHSRQSLEGASQTNPSEGTVRYPERPRGKNTRLETPLYEPAFKEGIYGEVYLTIHCSQRALVLQPLCREGTQCHRVSEYSPRFTRVNSRTSGNSFDSEIRFSTT